MNVCKRRSYFGFLPLGSLGLGTGLGRGPGRGLRLVLLAIKNYDVI